MAEYADMLLGTPEQQAPQTPKQGPLSYSEMLLGNQDVRGGMKPQKGPLTPSEQQAADLLAKVKQDPEKAAPIGRTALVSFADEPENIIRQYASRRFPDMPVDEAMDRYAMIGDQVIYKGNDGNLYAEVPKGWSPSALAHRAASVSSKVIPFAAETAAGVVTAPMILTGPAGTAASVGLTGAAGAAGEAVRQGIGKLALDDPMSGKEIAKEGVISAAGQLLSAGVIKFLGRNMAKDIRRLDMPQAEQLQRTAQGQGIDLTPAELTNLPSLKAQQKALGNLSASSDDLADFYARRSGQVDEAVTNLMNKISPTDSAEVAGKQISGAAKAAIEAAKAERQKVAGPIYREVIKPENVIPDEKFASVAGDDFLKNTIAKVKNDPLYGLKDLPDNSMPVVDMAKRHIDDLIESAKRAGENNKVRLLQGKKDTLVSIADAAFPDYQKARAMFSGKSPEVESLQSGIVGLIEDLPNTKLQEAARKIFDPSASGPQSLAQTRAALQKTDPEAWQAIKRAWLQQQWEKAGTQTLESGGQVVNQGAKFRKLILGDVRRQAMLKAALEPDEYRALSDLANVLEASGRVKPIGSDTAWNAEMMRSMRNEATPALAKASRLIRPQDWGKMIEEWATERSMQSNAQQLVDIVTSPEGLKQLKALRQVSPTSAKAVAIVGQVLGILPDAVSSNDTRISGQQVLQSEGQQ